LSDELWSKLAGNFPQLLRFDGQHNDGNVLNGLGNSRGRDYLKPLAQPSACGCVDFYDRDLACSYALLQ